MFCGNCGHKFNNLSDKFCPKCGAKRAGAQPANNTGYANRNYSSGSYNPSMRQSSPTTTNIRMPNLGKKHLAIASIAVAVIVAIILIVNAGGGRGLNDNGLPRNISRALVGTWELYESNMWGVADTVQFRSDGTGTMWLGAVRENFTWSVAVDELVLVQVGGLLTIAYTITRLNDSTLSYEANISGLGFVSMTYTR